MVLEFSLKDIMNNLLFTLWQYEVEVLLATNWKVLPSQIGNGGPRLSLPVMYYRLPIPLHASIICKSAHSVLTISTQVKLHFTNPSTLTVACNDPLHRFFSSSCVCLCCDDKYNKNNYTFIDINNGTHMNTGYFLWSRWGKLCHWHVFTSFYPSSLLCCLW